MKHNLTNGSLVTTLTQDQIITVILIGLLILTLLVLNIVFYLTYRNVVNDYNQQLERNLNISNIFMNQIKPLIGTVVRSQRQGTTISVSRVNSERSVSHANSERSEADTLPKKIAIEEDFIDNQETAQSVKPKMNHFYSKQSYQLGDETKAIANRSNPKPNLRGSQDIYARSSPKQNFPSNEETKATTKKSKSNPNLQGSEGIYARSSPKQSFPSFEETKATTNRPNQNPNLRGNEEMYATCRSSPKQSFQRSEETKATTNRPNQNPNLRGNEEMYATCRSSPKQSFQRSEETKATTNRSNPNLRDCQDIYARSSPELRHTDNKNTKNVEAMSPKPYPSKSHLTPNSVDAIARSTVFKLESKDNIPQSYVTNLEQLQSAKLQSIKSQSLSILNIRNINTIKNVHFDKDTKMETAMIRSASANDGFVTKDKSGEKTHTRVFHNDQATNPVPISFVKPGTKTPVVLDKKFGNSADSIRLSTMTVTHGSMTVQVTDLSQTNLKEKDVNVFTINKSEALKGQKAEVISHHQKFNAKGDNPQSGKYQISQVKQCDQYPLQKLKIHSQTNPVKRAVDKSKNISLTHPMPCSSDVPISSQSRLVTHSEKGASQWHVQVPSSERGKTALLTSESVYPSDQEKRKSLTRSVFSSSERVNNPSLTRPVKLSQPLISQIARCSNSSIKITDDSVGDKRVCERNVSTDTINSLEVAILASEEDNYGEIEIVDNSSLARLKRPRSIHDDYPVVEFQNLAFDISETKTDDCVGDIEL
ncbi:hypothetical protein SNE40_006212 [Patella caerulea]|uniref:Uncharacterized protein n=1 Tax=Patella caerulea TaxID=87958 RepID=A0AAN8Q475_PATCE